MHASHFLHSPLLSRAGVRHAFFTRLGGVSEGPLSSLNTSVSVGDSVEHVEENLSRASRAVGVDRQRLLVASQVHGCEVLEIAGDESAQAIAAHQADGLHSSNPTLACGVRTADCVPILLCDLATGQAAAVHAGWRGVVSRISVAAVEQLVQRFAKPSEIMAAIGPHIGVDAFEVGVDVAEKLAGCSRAEGVVLSAPGRRPHVDLATIVKAQLEEAGLRPTQIECVGSCTYSTPHLFYSHRRDGGLSGRLLSAIVPPGRRP